MAKRPVDLFSAEYDTVANTLSLTMAEIGFPVPPPNIREDLWTEGPHAKVTLTVNIQKPVEVAPTGMETRLLPGNIVAQYRWTHNGTAWVNPVRVNIDGTPYVP
jgi:hypothetical protein